MPTPEQLREATRDYCQESERPFTESDIDALLANPEYVSELITVLSEPTSDASDLFVLILEQLYKSHPFTLEPVYDEPSAQ